MFLTIYNNNCYYIYNFNNENNIIIRLFNYLTLIKSYVIDFSLFTL
jgi:hypothetical protein